MDWWVSKFAVLYRMLLLHNILSLPITFHGQPIHGSEASVTAWTATNIHPFFGSSVFTVLPTTSSHNKCIPLLMRFCVHHQLQMRAAFSGVQRGHVVVAQRSAQLQSHALGITRTISGSHAFGVRAVSRSAHPPHPTAAVAVRTARLRGYLIRHQSCPQESEAHVASACLGENVRKDFPILEQAINGQPLVYLDNAATSQKPLYMLQAMDNYYDTTNSNVHRGVHALSAQATADYESARAKVASFIKAQSWREIVFTRNATEGMNLVAYSWGMHNLKPGDEVRSILVM